VAVKGKQKASEIYALLSGIRSDPKDVDYEVRLPSELFLIIQAAP
jgi:hypothetical protein